jgi:Raf kinase inhibitor-like YbhB/YbcL family protein
MRLLIIIAGLFISSWAYASDFVLASNTVMPNKMVPRVNTCDKGNVTPELHWSGAPEKTQSFVLVGVGYDSPMGKVYGWIVYNIPVNVHGLPAGVENLPQGAQVGKNSLGDSSYRGPCPPDAGLHHYGFELYALDAPVTLEGDDNGKSIMEAIKPHILKEAQLKVIYRH